MATITSENNLYYISRTALVLTENALGTTDPTSHRYISASVASNTKIKVKDGLAVKDAGGQMIPVTSLANDLQYERWTVKAYNTVLNEMYDSLAVNIYTRLNRNDYTDGLVVYTSNDYDYIGRILDPEGEFDPTDTTTPDTAPYLYIKIGNLTAPVNGKRSMSYDTGCLQTPADKPEEEELRKMFVIDNNKITPQKWFSKVETYILTMLGADGSELVSISSIVKSLSNAVTNTAIPTAKAVVDYVVAQIESLSSKYLSKQNDDVASGRITFNKGISAKDFVDSEQLLHPSVNAETVVADKVETTDMNATNIDASKTTTEELEVSGESTLQTTSITELSVSGDAEIAGKSTLHETSVTDFSASGDATIDGDVEIEGTTTHNGNVLIDNDKSLQSKDYAGGIAGGYGWKIYKDANGQIVAEFDSMILRHFLEVPEFRYNRITVTNGILWVSPAAGLIERVEIDTSNPSKGTVYLKLEEGEFSSFAVNDICMGIYHFENGNANVDADDGHGNFSMKGFSTIYFKVTNVDSNGKWFKYQLGNGSTKHPVASMSIIAYGNTTDTSRQRSLYMTKSYSRYIVNVNDYTFTNDNVAMQWGDLSNLGTGMNGYSMYLNNIYMSGTIKQLKNERGDEIKLINYRGAWDSNTQYYKDDEVFYNGSLWLANNNNKGSEPTDTNTDWQKVSGKGDKGDTGGLIRLRGVWASQTTTSNAYVSNSQWRDVVIYNGNYYIVKEGKTATIQDPTNTTYWEPFNQFDNVATSVLLANKGYIDVLGTGQAFIGQTQNGAGWYMTQGKIEYRPSASASPTLTLTNDGKIIATDGSQIIVRDGGVERSVWGTIKGLTDGQFSIWQSSDNAPTSSDDIPWNSSLVPSKDWTDKDSHLNDILIFKNGITYRFVFKNNTYVWTIFTDKYLVDVTNSINDIFADNKITPDEKKELAKIRQEVNETASAINAKVSELTTEEISRIVTYLDNYAFERDKLLGKLNNYLSDMTTTTVLSGTDTDTRSYMVNLIATVQSLASELLRLIDEVKLASTGIDIGNRIITLTADKFKIINNSGEETLNFNEAGNMNIKGILVKNSFLITAQNAKHYLLPSHENSFCDSEYRNFSYYSNTSRRSSIIGNRSYFNGTELETIDTFSPFCSTEISVPANNLGQTLHTHSLDVLLVDGLVVFDNSLLSGASDSNRWLISIDAELGNMDNVILLPFMQRDTTAEGLYSFASLRTPTSNLGTKHLITVNEMRSLVGKRIAICNATNTHIYVTCASGFSAKNYPINTVFLDKSGSTGAQQAIDVYNGLVGYVQVASGESIVVEYQEAMQGSSMSLDNLSADIVPMLIAKTNQAQGYVESMIKASDTFGDEYKITTNNE